MLFKGRKSHSRTEILETAGKAQARGKRRKAIAEYQKILKVDPDDYVVHGKIAPLLAGSRRFSDAWSSFEASGQGYIQRGFVAQALSVYTQATRHMPGVRDAWEAVIRLQLERGQEADAVKTALTGQRNFRTSALRPDAIRLLRKAWEISPWHYDVTVELARLLSKTGEKKEALRLLIGLAERARGRKLRQVRALILRISPTTGSLWRWLRASFHFA
ncbi:MAG: tetratricopeptide repeat protein [Thermodesulfobacteriota bacterium]